MAGLSISVSPYRKGGPGEEERIKCSPVRGGVSAQTTEHMGCVRRRAAQGEQKSCCGRLLFYACRCSGRAKRMIPCRLEKRELLGFPLRLTKIGTRWKVTRIQSDGNRKDEAEGEMGREEEKRERKKGAPQT